MKRILLPLAIAAALVQGCATTPPPYKLYEGEVLQDAKISKLVFDEARQTQPFFGYWEWVELRSVDGRSIPQESRLRREYQVLPGTRQVTVRYKYESILRRKFHVSSDIATDNVRPGPRTLEHSLCQDQLH